MAAKAPFLESLLWPWFAAASAGEAAASAMAEFAQHTARENGECGRTRPQWTTSNSVALELPTMQLRDFSTGRTGPPTVICAPYALHSSVIADLAVGHSLVMALQDVGLKRLFVTDWRSATPEMRSFSIDTYLADLNVAIDEVGERVNLIGICQGGWMSFLFAARFPGKVRQLVLAGAPLDIGAGVSNPSRFANSMPIGAFRELVHAGKGRVLGRHLLEFWSPQRPNETEVRQILQLEGAPCEHEQEARARFDVWHEWAIDLPGVFYLQVVEQLFRENRLADGRFVALGKQIDPKSVRVPLHLLAGRDDDTAPKEQVFGIEPRVGTGARRIKKTVAPCGHLALFVGAKTLTQTWPAIGRSLTQSRA